MAEPLRPDATKTYGRENWVIIPAVADINAITAVEWNGASALDVTNILFASSGKPAQTTNLVSAARRMGDTKTYQSVGTSDVAGGELRYAFADQADAGEDGKKLFEMLPEGTTAVLAQRKGVAKATAAATGQFYNAHPVQFGPSFPDDEGDSESAESAMVCTFAITGPSAINKALA